MKSRMQLGEAAKAEALLETLASAPATPKPCV